MSGHSSFLGSSSDCNVIKFRGERGQDNSGTERRADQVQGERITYRFKSLRKIGNFTYRMLDSQGEIAMDGDFRSRAARMPLTPTRPP